MRFVSGTDGQTCRWRSVAQKRVGPFASDDALMKREEHQMDLRIGVQFRIQGFGGAGALPVTETPQGRKAQRR